MKPFLWEIGCEEIPASWLRPALSELKARVTRDLEALELAPSKLETFGTARRLVVHAAGLPEKQEDRREQVTGPPLKAARDASGKWTQAALGFAKKNAIDPGALAVVTTPKGEYVGFEREIKGAKTKALLPGLMGRTLRALPFPKFMNWDASLEDGQGAFPFGRPIRWMVALFGTSVVPFRIEVLGSPAVESGRKSRGHRFLAPKGGRAGAPFAVASFSDLTKRLRQHYVILDPDDREKRLEAELQKLERKAKGRRAAGLEPGLVAQLVEWPGAVLGAYPAEFMSLPEEVRHTVLIHHQHYFPIQKKPLFIAPTNMPADRKHHIRRGAERVVVARLRDAKFFWEDDLKEPLEDRLQALEGVTFHQRLGSYRLKAERMSKLASFIAEKSGARELPVLRAALLAKCDLTTGMVGEFPELQGVMGGLYAQEQGEPEAVWKAVYSHYHPVGLGEEDAFPANREGAVVALADKLDTLAALFAAGVKPKGSSDPFGLRRAALGVIRILMESEARVGLLIEVSPRRLVERALEIVAEQLPKVDETAEASLLDFMTERLRYVLGRRYRYDEILAVFALAPLDEPVETVEARLDALAASRGSADYEALSAAFKRVGNILSDHEPSTVDASLLAEAAERSLHEAVENLAPRARKHVEAREYGEALSLLSGLRPAVDRFFDEVLVMAEDEAVRRNRLALLHSLRELFLSVADLSQIVPESS